MKATPGTRDCPETHFTLRISPHRHNLIGQVGATKPEGPLRRFILIVVAAGTTLACSGEPRESSEGRMDSQSVDLDAGQAGAPANGERIFLSATSRTSPPISSTGARRPDGKPLVSCADCHGSRGEGGLIAVGERRVPAPPIQYSALTVDRERMGVAPYTDATLGLTLRTGITPDGRKLDTLMPRWKLGADDLRDLTLHLKSLSPKPGDSLGP